MDMKLYNFMFFFKKKLSWIQQWLPDVLSDMDIIHIYPFHIWVQGLYNINNNLLYYNKTETRLNEKHIKPG
jgi:hypothetical protein